MISKTGPTLQHVRVSLVTALVARLGYSYLFEYPHRRCRIISLCHQPLIQHQKILSRVFSSFKARWLGIDGGCHHVRKIHPHVFLVGTSTAREQGTSTPSCPLAGQPVTIMRTSAASRTRRHRTFGDLQSVWSPGTGRYQIVSLRTHDVMLVNPLLPSRVSPLAPPRNRTSAYS